MNLDRPLSTLELTVLGVILKRGPCVANAVVNEFVDSQTLVYRSGAGSIYPLMKRMHSAGLLACDKKKYTITDAGIEALRQWIIPPDGLGKISTNLDVLRSRVYFLKLLSEAEIERFFEEAIAGLESTLLTSIESMEYYQGSGDRYSEMAMLGTVRETEARIAWIKEIRKSLGSS
jgi:DNA-binding PadR family transcriptional regulator